MRVMLAGFVLALMLCGCSSVQLGIPETQWQAADAHQKKKLLKDYQRIQKEKTVELLRTKVTKDTPRVQLTIEGGKALMPPFKERYRFKSAKMIVVQGRCQTVRLVQESGSQHIDLEACYRGNEVFIDPSKYDYEWRYGTVRILESPIWLSGFSYHGISTNGYVKLQSSDITIKKIKL